MIAPDEVIVILSHLPLNYPCDYIKQTSLELAKRNKLIIFSPLSAPISLRQFLNTDLRSDGLLVLPPVGLLPFQRFNFIRILNHKLKFKMYRILFFLKFGLKRPIFWGFDYHLADVLSNFNWGEKLIYDRVDEPASLDPKADFKIKQKDKKFIKAADIVFTNSPYGFEKIKRLKKKVYLVPCGCAVDSFAVRIFPTPELNHIRNPIIGLIGSLDHRLDFRILIPLIKNNPQWSFVFIGDSFSNERKQFEIIDLERKLNNLNKFPNVYFLGHKPKNKLASYIKFFSVCLIPYNVNLETVKGCNPMKLYEYLSSGKPVVSTPITAVEVYKPLVNIAKNNLDFEKEIRDLLIGDELKIKRKRKLLAMENSWSRKVDTIVRNID